MYDIEKVPGIHFYKTNNIKIKFADKPKKNWCIDGEMLDDDSKVFEINTNNNIPMMIPKKNIDKLFIEK